MPAVWNRLSSSGVDRQSTGRPPSSQISLSCRSGHMDIRSQMFKCNPWAFYMPYPFLSLAHSSRLLCHHSLYLHSILTLVLIELCSVSPAGLFRVPFHKRGNVRAARVMYVRHSLMSKSPYGVPHSSALWTLRCNWKSREWRKKWTGRDEDWEDRQMNTGARSSHLHLDHKPPEPTSTSKSE